MLKLVKHNDKSRKIRLATKMKFTIIMQIFSFQREFVTRAEIIKFPK